MTTKKTVVSSRKKPRKPLVRAQFAQCFWVHDGPVLADLAELRDFLDTMNAKQWKHHVTKEKNDFANWIQDVLRDADCAKRMRAAKTRTEARAAMEKSL